MATDLNTLKNWFKTGLKPTQKQFWAWMDSYWHKNDKIPQSQIEGLDKSLENKAETSDLNTKANADATGLGDDNIISWKKALGVGGIPKNMAKIDTDSEQGNVHTKEQIAELLENSGKNIANTDLTTTGVRTFTQSYNYTHNTAGYYYFLTGLADKSNDTTYDTFLVQNSAGHIVRSNAKTMFSKQAELLTDKTNDSSFNGILAYNPTTNEVGRAGVKNLVATLQTATQTEIDTVFNILGGNYKGITSPVINAIFPPAAPMSSKANTLTFTLYGSGLNVLHDGSGRVKIIDTQTNQHIEVGWNSDSDKTCEIYVPSTYLAIGKTFRVEIQNGLLHTESTNSFEIVAPEKYTEIDTHNLLWEEEIYDQARYESLHHLVVSESKNQVTIDANGNESDSKNQIYTAQKLDLSTLISSTDNFSISLDIEVARTGQYAIDKWGVGFVDKNSYTTPPNLVPTGSNILMYNGRGYNRGFSTAFVSYLFGILQNAGMYKAYDSKKDTFILVRKNSVYYLKSVLGLFSVKDTNIITDLIMYIAIEKGTTGGNVKINKIIKW